MKKNYSKPAIIVVKTEVTGIICQSNTRSADSNVGIKGGTMGSSQAARSPLRNMWGEEGE